MSFAPHRASSLMLLLGCCFFGGCTWISNVQATKIPYTLNEQGETKKLYGYDADATLFVVPFVPIEGSMLGVHLRESEGKPFSPFLETRTAMMPQWRHVRDLVMLAEAISGPYAPGEPVTHLEAAIAALPSQEGVKKEPIRWIISTNPVVVAIGTDEMPSRGFDDIRVNEQGVITLPHTFRLASEEDLDHTAVMLYTLLQWPKEWPNEEEDHDGAMMQAFKRVMAKSAGQIPLSEPKKLRDLLKTRPWERHP